jgi:peptide/nickel transport system permease protein
MFVAVTLGVFFGAVAGYFGGLADGLIMRLVDILLAFPRLLLLLLIVSVYEGAGIFTVVLILGATGWMGVSRLVRAQFLQVKELDYAHAAKALGFSRARIMFRHLLPNSMAPVIVNATLLVGNTILVEAALSFLGFGVKPPDASWGNIIADGRSSLQEAWWIATIPGLCIVFTVVCFNLAGDALRDALDPKGRR